MRLGRTVFHADGFMKENGNGKRKRSLGCARDDETGETLLHVFFIPLRKPTSAPFGAPPSRGRRENAASQTSHEEGLRYENTAPPHSSFRAKARNLFRLRSGKKREGSGERETPCFMRLGRTVLHAGALRRKTEEGNVKRSLGCARDDETGKGISYILFQPIV